jgi:NADPH:quinone reductase-like Zn-dependent oxidoreductase
MGFNLSYLFDHSRVLTAAMEQLTHWVEGGLLRPPPVRAFPLGEAAAAQRALETGATVGKLVLVPERPSR